MRNQVGERQSAIAIFDPLKHVEVRGGEGQLGLDAGVLLVHILVIERTLHLEGGDVVFGHYAAEELLVQLLEEGLRAQVGLVGQHLRVAPLQQVEPYFVQGDVREFYAHVVVHYKIVHVQEGLLIEAEVDQLAPFLLRADRETA